jgi:hypothetical protein
MRLLDPLRKLLPARASAEAGCFSCTSFCDDPARIERELPGLAVLSSAHASVRAQDGLCLRHHLLTHGRGHCEAYA